jgi:hypothetical protein
MNSGLAGGDVIATETVFPDVATTQFPLAEMAKPVMDLVFPNAVILEDLCTRFEVVSSAGLRATRKTMPQSSAARAVRSLRHKERRED